MSFEVGGLSEGFSECSVVVDFTVDGENDGTIFRFEGLRSSVCFLRKGWDQLGFDRKVDGDGCREGRWGGRWQVRREEGE